MGIKAFAPASIGNIGIGFDILGMAIEKPGDEVIARKSDTPGLRITKITGHGGRLLEHLGETGRGIDLEIHKKLPLSRALGLFFQRSLINYFHIKLAIVKM